MFEKTGKSLAKYAKHGKLSKKIISKTFEETWEILSKMFEKVGKS